MASSTQTRPARVGRALLPSTLTLAGQRARQTWGLLLLTELGLLGAVLLACVVPLYANVTMTAALRGTLNAQNSDIVVRTLPQLVSAPVISQTTQTLNKELGHTLGSYLNPSQFSIETQTLQLLASNAQGNLSSTHIGFSMISAEMQQAVPHLTLNAGHLPDPAASQLEIAVTPDTARLLNASVGDLLYARLDFTDVYNKTYPQILTFRLSGLFTPTSGDAFWHGDDFTPYTASNIHLYALIPNETLLNTLARFSTAAATHNRVFVSPPDVIWYYHLNASHLAIGDLSTLLAGIQQIQVDNANNASLEQDPYLEQTQTYLPSPDALNNLNARLAVIQFPVLSLVVMILGLILFFLALMIHLLIDRQSAAIALLRSRGASRRQILLTLVLQGIIMAALALVLGLLLTPWLVSGLAGQMLAGHDQGALNILAGGPIKTAQQVGLYALLTVAVALITIVVAVWTAARSDIVSLRRETARSTRRPLWQRLRLDIVAAVIALIGYGTSFYLLNSNTLNGQLYLLFLSPLALLQTLLTAPGLAADSLPLLSADFTPGNATGRTSPGRGTCPGTGPTRPRTPSTSADDHAPRPGQCLRDFRPDLHRVPDTARTGCRELPGRGGLQRYHSCTRLFNAGYQPTDATLQPCPWRSGNISGLCPPGPGWSIARPFCDFPGR